MRFENGKCKNIWNARLQNGFELDSSRPELGNIITSPEAQKFKKKVMQIVYTGMQFT